MVLEEVTVEEDPIGAILYARQKHNKAEAPIAPADIKKLKIPLISSAPKLTVSLSGNATIDLLNGATKGEEKKTGKVEERKGQANKNATATKSGVDKKTPATKMTSKA